MDLLHIFFKYFIVFVFGWSPEGGLQEKGGQRLHLPCVPITHSGWLEHPPPPATCNSLGPIAIMGLLAD